MSEFHWEQLARQPHFGGNPLCQKIAPRRIMLMKRMHANAITIRAAGFCDPLPPGVMSFIPNADPIHCD
jgi:hypothetical protein